jgi:hypothetical protein
MNQSPPPPQPQSIPLGPFQIFSKIRGDIRKSSGINDTGSNFDTGVNDTSGKFAIGVNDTGLVANNRNNYQTADNLK